MRKRRRRGGERINKSLRDEEGSGSKYYEKGKKQ